MKSLVVILSLIAAPALAQPSADSLRARMPARPETLSRVVHLPVYEVSASRAEDRAPIAKTVLDRAGVQMLNWGQDTPMALATLAGTYAYSDAGNGIGYSYLSIRGFPQRRISVLVNGVPLNDPESHEVYWIDHPDLLASTAEVQVQRGVGSALYGAASLGGSVNLETAPFASRSHASAAWSYGSFDTRRLVLEMDSGTLLDDPRPGSNLHSWNFYGRYSRIETDGYRDQSWSKLWSYALSTQRRSGNHLLKLNVYGGPEQTHLAYLGIPRTDLEGGITGDADRDRRVNPITYAGEADHFFEPHYELVHSWSPREGMMVSQTLFYFDGEGYYDERRILQSLAAYRLSPWTTSDPTLFGADSLAYYRNNGIMLDRDAQGRVTVENFDAVRRRWVGNRHFGWIPRLRLGHPGRSLMIGGELRWHDGRHVGSVISGSGLPPGSQPDHVYYDYHPRTFSSGLFARQEWTPFQGLTATFDLAWRHEDYLMRGDQFDGIRFDQGYDFAIPRLGLRWTGDRPWTFFAAAAHSRREPAFRDLYDAEGVGSVPLFRDGEPLIRPERVNDYEAGAHWWHRSENAGLTLFRMDFRDELVYAGQFNSDLGYPILGNAARSVHQGAEIEASAQLGYRPRSTMDERPPHVFGSREWPELQLSANATLSDNHFLRYREIYGTSPGDTVSYDGKAIGFFPAVMGNLSARLGWHGATAGADIQHVGRIYLDQTEEEEGSIAPHTVLNLNAGYRLPLPDRDPLDEAAPPAVEISLRVFNALDRRYETSGYSYLYAGTRYTDFIPAATRNILAQVRVVF
jgi:iron complex outermembrane receptor protein